MISPGLFRRRPRPARALPQVESLEARTVPYSASGNLWPHPELITLSFEPDNTNLGGQSSNLVSTFNNAFGSASAWQNVILQAAQAWAQQANINFAVVNDSGADSGAGNYQQGDPNFGDIRVGGFDLGDSTLLGLAYMPPSVNNYSIAGDITFNTAQVFNINGLDYDLYTVAVHELGHALGLGESDTSRADMYGYYQGSQSGLFTDDVNGIQHIYGARPADGSNTSFSAASDITSNISPTALTATLTGLNISTTSDQDYYKFTAPSGGSGSLALTVQSTALSLLAPSVKVYDANQHQIASAAGSGYLGSTLSLNVSVTAGQTYYVRVTGAVNTAFGTGAYGMTLNLGTGSSPTLPLPNTQTANGNPLSGGGGVALHTGDGDAMQIAPGFVPRTARPAATPQTSPPTRPPAGIVPVVGGVLPGGSAGRADGTAVIAPADQTAAPAPGSPGAAAAAPLSPPLSRVVVAWAPEGDDTAEPVPEPLSPPAEWDAGPGIAPTPAPEALPTIASDACFDAADGPFAPSAGAAFLRRHEEPAPEAGAVVEPGALATAMAVALGLSWGGRPAATEARRRLALAG